MPDSMRYNDWFSKARSEYEGANILMEHGGDYALVAFLSQQAVEKAFKGYILKNREELIEGHSLIYLCKISAEIDCSIKQFIKDAAYVNQFYLETRYPADIPIGLNKDEAQECFHIAKTILDRLLCE